MSDIIEQQESISPEALVEKLNAEKKDLVGVQSVTPSVAVEASCSPSIVTSKSAVISADAPVAHQPISFDGFDIKDPVVLLFLLDKRIQSGEIKLHPWQIQFMLDFANEKHTKDSPFQAAAQTCNGSGKDKYIIAACAVWLCMRFRDASCPVTSSSGDQLDKQTSVHIDRLCYAANALFGPIWKIQYRYYELQHKNEDGSPAPSVITLFATDESGKAEGYHPVDSGKKMAIFTGETKSIPEEIIEALSRCHGFTHRVDVSSPGISAGYFYNKCTSAMPRDTIEDIKTLSSSETILYRVDYYQCPHITESEAERMAADLVGGRSNPVFRSSMLAEFATTDEMVVVKSNFAWKAYKTPPEWIPEVHNTGGLDLSDGGAETVLAIRNGNKLLKEIPFRIDDEMKKILFLEQQFKENGLDHNDALIFGDFTGIGGPTLKMLKSRGWKNIRFVDSRHKAAEPKTYANRATELFFHMALLLERWEIDLAKVSKQTIQQLCTRYYKLTTANIHALLSKQEQRSRGYLSPDRADALNLCFWNYKSTKVPEVESAPFEIPKTETEQKIVPEFDLNEWATRDQKKFKPEYTPSSDVDDLAEEIKQYNQRQLLCQIQTN